MRFHGSLGQSALHCALHSLPQAPRERLRSGGPTAAPSLVPRGVISLVPTLLLSDGSGSAACGLRLLIMSNRTSISLAAGLGGSAVAAGVVAFLRWRATGITGAVFDRS